MYYRSILHPKRSNENNKTNGGKMKNLAFVITALMAFGLSAGNVNAEQKKDDKISPAEKVCCNICISQMKQNLSHDKCKQQFLGDDFLCATSAISAVAFCVEKCPHGCHVKALEKK